MLPHPPSPSKPRERSYITKPQPSEERPGHVHVAGTEVKVVEVLGAACIVEVRVPDESLVGGAWYDTIEVSIWNLKAVYDPTHHGPLGLLETAARGTPVEEEET